MEAPVNVNSMETPHEPMVDSCRNEMPATSATADDGWARFAHGLRSAAMLYHRHGGPPVPKTVSMSEFERHTLAYLREVEETGEALILTDRGRVVLRVVLNMPAEDALAALRGCVVRYDAPTKPVASDAWGAGG